jgi:hypothetical protein
MWSLEGNRVPTEDANNVPKAYYAMENDSLDSRCCSCSTGHSPVSSPIALRCRSTSLSNLLNKNEVLDRYIDGGQEDNMLNDKQKPHYSTSTVSNLGRPPRPQSGVPSAFKSAKDVPETYPDMDSKDVYLHQLAQEVTGDTCNITNLSNAGRDRLSTPDVFEIFSHLEDYKTESLTSVEDIYEDLQYVRPPNVTWPSICPVSGMTPKCSFA